MSLRLVLVAVVFAGFIIGFIGSIPLVNSVARVPGPYNVIAVPVIASCVALGAGWAAEKLLTARWPSGRTLLVSHQGITLQERSGASTMIVWDQRINILTWHFVIRRGRAWVPKGWYCLACQLKQDEAAVIAYAFVKPEVAQTIPEWKAFEELLARKVSGKDAKDHPLSDIGAQAQLRYAELDRWHIGVEMAPGDFTQFIAELHQRVPAGFPVAEPYRDDL
jgi:hypothetical protein